MDLSMSLVKVEAFSGSDPETEGEEFSGVDDSVSMRRGNYASSSSSSGNLETSFSSSATGSDRENEGGEEDEAVDVEKEEEEDSSIPQKQRILLEAQKAQEKFYENIKKNPKIPKGCHPCPTPGCGRKFKYYSQLRQHSERHALKKCPEKGCGMEFVEKKEFYKHMKMMHGKTKFTLAKIHKCRICGLECENAHALSTHRDFHDEGGKYACKICKKNFFYWQGRKNHQMCCGKVVVKTKGKKRAYNRKNAVVKAVKPPSSTSSPSDWQFGKVESWVKENEGREVVPYEAMASLSLSSSSSNAGKAKRKTATATAAGAAKKTRRASRKTATQRKKKRQSVSKVTLNKNRKKNKKTVESTTNTGPELQLVPQIPHISPHDYFRYYSLFFYTHFYHHIFAQARMGNNNANPAFNLYDNPMFGGFGFGLGGGLFPVNNHGSTSGSENENENGMM